MKTQAKEKTASSENPGVKRSEFIRLTHGAGLSLFGYVTLHAPEELLKDGYFDAVQDSLEKFDRIEATAGAGGRKPTHMTLAVNESDHEAGVKVEALR